MTKKSILSGILLALIISILSSSCSTPKNIAYFQGAENMDLFEIVETGNKTIKIEPHDKLSIMVSCKDPALAQLFNLQVYTNTTAQRSGFNGSDEFRSYNVGYSDGINGFTVSAEGTIDYPVLGTLKVAGMTRSELSGFIKGEIMGRGLIKDPVVTVEFLNVGVSILGEVANPGRFDMNVDVLPIMEALSLAKDLTIQGNRQNIKVLRKEGDKVRTYVVDITDTKKLVNSPAYYLKQGDIVYVEPNDFKKRQTTNNGNSVMNVSFWLSVASLLTSAAILFKR